MTNRLATLMTAVVITTAVPAHAAQTIVGAWAPDPRECTPVGGMVSIQPMGLAMGDEYMCSFHDVARSGQVVTWHGTCAAPEQAGDKSTVVAETRGDRLYIRLNGASNGPYRRCRLTGY